MKHEIVELHDVQIIGMGKKIAFNEAKEECPKFRGEYVEKIVKRQHSITALATRFQGECY
ncbi:MAG: hypothetical protein IKX25_05205 [Bacteroidales bacterium]|nr:hypothetical protein [Bacteroidales bacterium]